MVQTKIIIGLAVTVVLSVVIALVGADYTRLRNAAAQNEQRGGVITSTSEGIKEGQELDAVQEAYNQGLADARTNFQHSKQEAKRNEPETAARAVRTVPDSVRAAYRERRLARQRLGCAGGECQEDDNANAAAKR